MTRRTNAAADLPEDGRKTPRLPGSISPASGPVSLARIFLAPRDPGRGGLGRTHGWLLSFEPSAAPFIEPLMGWTGSRDPYRPIELHFPDRESAVAFAERQGWAYEVIEPPRRTIRPKSYAEDLRRRLRASVSTLALQPTEAPAAAPSDVPGARDDMAQTGERSQQPIDPVEEASIESFPASDPPAWTGVSLP